MRNSQNGIIVPILIGIIVVLLITGGVYIYIKESAAPTTSDNIDLSGQSGKIDFRSTTISQVPQDSSASLTVTGILNSNGFVDGKKNPSKDSTQSIGNIIFGNLDEDASLEAVALETSCGASCGMDVLAFKLVGNDVRMVTLPESAVSGALQEAPSVVIDKGIIVVRETDNSGTRVNNYQVKFVDNKLIAIKLK